MFSDPLRIARDYNRGLPAPVRYAHIAAAVALIPLRAARAWVTAETRRDWALPLLLGIAAFIVLLPFDGLIARAAVRINIGGDVRRELEALQQFGQGSSIIIVTAIVWLMDPPRRKRLADWFLALILVGIAVKAAKLLIGRPRPKFDDPWVFLGPYGQYPVDGVGIRHAWEIGSGILSDLWSLPSSHTAYAVVMAAFVAILYPRLRILIFTLAAVVGFSRVLFRAHYPTDVVAGALLGWLIAYPIIARGHGARLLAAIRRRPAPATPLTSHPAGPTIPAPEIPERCPSG